MRVARQRRISAALLLLVVSLSPAAVAQNAAPVGSAFEAASLKPSVPNNLSGGYTLTLYPGGRLKGMNLSLQTLIQIAYDLKQKDQVTGALSWLDSQRYDLEATAGAAVGEPQARIMLQSLLQERFKLKFHRETREFPVYYLVTARNGVRGPNLREAPNGDCGAMTTPQAVPPPAGPGSPASPCGGMVANPGKISGHRTSIGELATNLSAMVGRPVFDKTGTGGTFDITLSWTPDQNAAPQLPPGQSTSDVPGGPSIYTALQEQLGLKLESGKGPVDIVVVDSAERTSEN